MFVEISVPSRVEHLDGACDVKQKKWIHLYFYEVDPKHQDIALAISNSVAGIKAFLKQLLVLN